jgi:hypothetical protein
LLACSERPSSQKTFHSEFTAWSNL